MGVVTSPGRAARPAGAARGQRRSAPRAMGAAGRRRRDWASGAADACDAQAASGCRRASAKARVSASRSLACTPARRPRKDRWLSKEDTYSFCAPAASLRHSRAIRPHNALPVAQSNPSVGRRWGTSKQVWTRHRATLESAELRHRQPLLPRANQAGPMRGSSTPHLQYTLRRGGMRCRPMLGPWTVALTSPQPQPGGSSTAAQHNNP